MLIKQAGRELDLKVLEERIQRSWKKNKIYEKSEAALRGKPKYYFLDGPPYASGTIHLGTAWNKILKDAAVRYLVMKGYKVHRQAGWDCHGLPIEIKVEEKLGIKNKKEIEELGVEKFVSECKKWAHQHMKIMTSQFQRLGVWMDWQEPYMTMKDEYIEAAWWTIKKAYEKDLLAKYLRVITWCPRCETALAEAEIEYEDRSDPSIYVKFPLLEQDEYLLVWTTTPWTLIGNLAVMVHPDFEYVRAKTPEGILILAKELAHVLKDKLGLEYEVIETVKGSQLEGLRYKNPLSDVINVKPESKNAYTVILSSEFVTLGEGTGCVHCAPGHGPEDFEVGARYGIEPLCPVDERGAFTKEAGKYQGLTVKKDDEIIMKDLKEKKILPLSETITHRYGHCWRCNTPIIYRAAEQWFIRISEIKDEMLRQIERVEWVPEWAGSARFKDWVENARDWTISRQRYWGIPLPIWVCENCGSIDVIGSKKELEKIAKLKVRELHKPYADKVKLPCKCSGKKSRVPDVLDVWFDSGVAAWASLSYPSKTKEFETWYPADFITEGHDQTRGWFYSQLGCGILAFGEVPYRRVLMHGFTLDEKGEKMSKSLGNVVQPEEVIDKYGAEVLRFYVLWSNKPWDDLRFNWEEVKVIARMFNVFWNVYVFATTYMSIDKFDPGKVKKISYKIEDRWMLSRLNFLLKEVTESFDKLHLSSAARVLQEFILKDLSRWYIALIRPRTWIEKDAPEKLSAYATLHEVLMKLSIALAPIAPHITEEIYRNLGGKKESVHLEKWVSSNEKAIDARLEEDMEVVRKLVEATASAREKRGIKRRWPVLKLIYQPSSEEAKSSTERLIELIKFQANALEVEVLHPGEKFKLEIKVEPNLSTLGPEFKEKAKRIVEKLKTLDGREVKEKIKEGYVIDINGEKITISEKHLNFKEAIPEKYSEAAFEFGRVYIDTEKTGEILARGYAREVVRRIQEMRKQQDLNVEAFIEANVEVKDEEIVELLNRQKPYIATETRAEKLNISSKLKHTGHAKEWSIGDNNFLISIIPLGKRKTCGLAHAIP
ncbi:MAG: isoleucine--tRNA ligase [Candidatus Hydrothermarchaeota archaeon]|nr:isoleucine--tRNA ligase [Candidatus Hydrothermarchaeota archaeon]